MLAVDFDHLLDFFGCIVIGVDYSDQDIISRILAIKLDT
jgi:hypothetical protein